MKTPWWQQEYKTRLPVIDTIEQWEALLLDSREAEIDITDQHIRQLTFENADWSGLGFMRIWFDNCRFPGIKMSQCTFHDTRWDNCDVSGGNLRRCRVHDCRFEKGKGVGLVISDSFFRKTSFYNWNGRYVQWSSCALEHMNWMESVCRESLFSDCPLKAVQFTHTDLQQAQFFKTYLKGIDLTSCQIDGLSVSDRMTELRGAIVDLYQAAELARMLGIEIR